MNRHPCRIFYQTEINMRDKPILADSLLTNLLDKRVFRSKIVFIISVEERALVALTYENERKCVQCNVVGQHGVIENTFHIREENFI